MVPVMVNLSGINNLCTGNHENKSARGTGTQSFLYAEICVGLHVKCLLLHTNFNQNLEREHQF